MKKRVLSTLLALCMMLALLPGTALAADYPKTVFNGHTYQLFEAPLTWTEAKEACEKMGGHLAVITSAAEQSFIEGLIKGGTKNHYWLGATNVKTGSWQWVTGEAFSYKNWDFIEPNNYLKKEFYLQIYRVANPSVPSSKANKWNDMSLDCTTNSAEKDFFNLNVTGYICEWENAQYTVSFNTNGGKLPANAQRTKNVTNGGTYGPLPTPTRTGYKFNGWYTGINSGSKVLSTTKVNLVQDQTLYAHWTKTETSSTCKITLNANGGKVSPATISVAKNTAYYSQLPTPTRSGYTFSGWYTAKSGGTKITSATKATANRTIYARWTRNKTYLVNFDPNGGTVYQDMKVVFSGVNYKDLPTPTRPNYHFKGWYTAKSGGTKVTASTRVKLSANQTLYAQWQTSATVRATENSKWTVTIPEYYELALYSTASASKITGYAAEKGVYQDIVCTQKATLSNGAVRYRGTVNGKSVWFTYSCEMDVR